MARQSTLWACFAALKDHFSSFGAASVDDVKSCPVDGMVDDVRDKDSIWEWSEGKER